MSGLRTKVEHWKNRWTLSRDVPLHTTLQASSNHSPESQLAANSNTGSSKIEPSPHRGPASPETQVDNPKLLSHSRQSSDAWRRALETVEKSEEWVKCCKIVKKQTGIDLPTSLVQGEPIAEITQHITRLVESKELSKSTRHQKVLDKTLSVLETVKDVGAGITALNPYAALGWGLVQYMVTVVSAGRAIQKECFEEFPRVLDLIIRYQTYEQLYSQSGSVQALKHDFDSKLQDLYVSVLHYQVTVVVTLFSPMTKVKIATAGEANSIYRAAFDDVQRKQNAWDSLRPLVDREVTDAQFRKVQDSCEELSSVSSVILHQLVVAAEKADLEKDRVQREVILKWISPISHESAHHDPKRLPRPRTADWLLKHPDYVAWTEQLDPACLWLQGFVGSGKSCLTHALINDQRSQCHTDAELSQILYFYCDGTDAERARQIDSHEKILRSLVKQITASWSVGPPPECISDAYNECDRGAAELREAQCLNLLVGLADPCIDLKIIIDGIDECPTEVQLNLVESLRRLTTQRCKALKVFIACRHTHDLDTIMASLARCTIDVAQHNLASVRMEIEARVSESLQIPHLRRLYWVGSRGLADKVITQLTENAGCMFRFVDSAFAYLHGSGNARLLENRLEDLNNLKGLADLYDRIWDTAMASQNDREKEVIITALTFVTHGFSYGIRAKAREDMSLKSLIWTWNSQHVLEACAFVLSGSLDDAWSIDELLAICPSFLTAPASALTNIQDVNDDQDPELPALDYEVEGGIRGTFIPENDLTLRIPHFSVTQYLLNRHSSLFNPAAANARIAALSLRVFDVIVDCPDFLDKQPNGLVLYAALTWPAHLRRSQISESDVCSTGPLASTVNSFLKDDDCSHSFRRWAAVMENYQQNLVRLGRGPLPKDQEKDYDFAVAAPLVTEPLSTLFARIYLGFPTETAEVRLCSVRSRWEYGTTTLVPQTFAAIVGRPSTIRRLRSRGFSTNEQDELGQTSGHILCKMGYTDAAGIDVTSNLRALVEAGLNLNTEDKQGNTCLSNLQESGVFSVEDLQIFQEAGIEIEAADLNREPRIFLLDSAIAFIPRPFRMSCLKFLLSCYSSRLPSVKSRTRLLFLAVKYEDAELAQYLIQKFGADPFVRNDAGLIPLQASLFRTLSTNYLAPRVLDVLAPVTFKMGINLKNAVGFNLTVLRAIQRECSWETVSLFIKFGAPIKEPSRCAWGYRPITEALLFNKQHGREIAENFWRLGVKNVTNSRIYRKWRDDILTDDEIGVGAYKDVLKLLLEDQCGEDEPWEEDQFWDALGNGEEEEDEGEFFDASEELVRS